MSTLKTTIEWPFQINGETDTAEQEITVEYDYYHLRRGERDSLCGVRAAGPPLEPDETAGVVINHVNLFAPTVYNPQATDDILDDLSDSQMDRLYELCLEDAAARTQRND